MHASHVAVFVLFATCVFDDVRAFESDNSIGFKTEVFGRRIESKVVLLDIQLS